jgi:hypothetical protein
VFPVFFQTAVFYQLVDQPSNLRLPSQNQGKLPRSTSLPKTLSKTKTAAAAAAVAAW